MLKKSSCVVKYVYDKVMTGKQYGGGKSMKRWVILSAMVLTITLLFGAAANAAKLVKIDELKIEADKNVSPLDYAFGQKAMTGRLEFGALKNLYGNGAGFIVYIDTSEQRNKWLAFKIDSGSMSARIVGQSSGIISFPPSTISNSEPLVLEIQDDALTIKAGKMSRTVKGVTGFSGGLTTQSIETLLKVYQWQDEE